MTGLARRTPDRVPRSVGAAAEAALGAGGDVRKLGLVLARSAVPIVLVDGERRYVDANPPARLVFRLSLQQLRTYTVDELTPPGRADGLVQAWEQLLGAGTLAGSDALAGPDGTRLDILYCALANVLPGLHLIVFAPAGWPEDELSLAEAASQDSSLSLTPREVEVLELAAEGNGAAEIAERLALSTRTVDTHFEHIYAKLGVHNRTGAVASAMRLGLIDC